MSEVVKLAGKLPADVETNGLDAQREDLLEEPTTLRLGVVWYDVRSVTENVDTGDHVPTIRIRRFEPLGNADDVSKEIRERVEKAIEERTGRTPLPMDVAEVIEVAGWGGGE